MYRAVYKLTLCRYRNTFASILVLGSILQKLAGDDVNQFERWRVRTPMSSSPTRMSHDLPPDPEGPQGAQMERNRDQTQDSRRSTGRHDSAAREMGRDIEHLAEDNFSGLTRLMFRQHTRQLRKSSQDDGPKKIMGKRIEP